MDDAVSAYTMNTSVLFMPPSDSRESDKFRSFFKIFLQSVQCL